MSSWEDQSMADLTQPAPVVGTHSEKDAKKSICVVSVDDFGHGDADTCYTNGEASLVEEKAESNLPMSRARCIALVATLTGANFLNLLNFQSIVIVLPMIGSDLGIREERQQWVIGSYALAFGCCLLIWGRMADLYSKRLIFILGLVWLTTFSVIAPFVSDKRAFIAVRGFQGVGAAATLPTAIGILGVTFPPGKAKNYAFTAYAGGSPLGFFCGTVLSCLIAQNSDWRWVFGALAIFASVNAVAAFFFIPSQFPVPPPPMGMTATTETNKSAASSHARQYSPLLNFVLLIDWVGAALITISVIGLIFALIEGSITSWKAPWMFAVIAVSCFLLGVFGFWEVRVERRFNQGHSACAPLVKLSILRNTRVTAAMVITGLVFAALSNYFVFTTFFFYNFQGLSLMEIMLRNIPAGVAGIINTIVVSQLIGRVPTSFIMAFGILGTSFACLLYAVPIPPTTSYWAYGLPAMLLVAAGPDATVPCVMLYISRALPRQEQAVAGALLHTIAQVSRTIGLTISMAVHTASMAKARHVAVGAADKILPWEPASLAGLRAASWTNFGFGISALVLVAWAFRSLEVIGKPNPAPRGVEQSDRDSV